MNFSTRTTAQNLKIPIDFGTNKLRHKSLTWAHVVLLHGAEVNIWIELGAEVNILCQSPQLGAEVTRAVSLKTHKVQVPKKNEKWSCEFSDKRQNILWKTIIFNAINIPLWFLDKFRFEVKINFKP